MMQTIPEDITYEEAKALLLSLPDYPPWWYIANPDVIPAMLDRMGKHWDQPSKDDIGVSESHAAMSPVTSARLHNYTHTMPTGVYPGKMWRAERADGWHLYWYGYSEKGAGFCSINHRKILYVGGVVKT